MVYGLPYMGSKNTIAAEIVSLLPPADVFCDVFAGGGAITHAAILSGKYKRVIANDITDSLQLFEDAIRGKYMDEKRWISREDFEVLRHTDPFVRLIWSFGNNSKNYMYNKVREDYKRRVHLAVYEGETEVLDALGYKIECDELAIWKSKTPAERMSILRKIITEFDSFDGSATQEELYEYNKLEEYSRLERLNSLTSLARFLPQMEFHRGDYRDLVIPDNAVVYCDPPYFSTASYLNEFDHAEFYEWCLRRDQVFVSEYQMPEEFKCVWEISKELNFASSGNSKTRERLFTPKTNEMKFTLFDIDD